MFRDIPGINWFRDVNRVMVKADLQKVPNLKQKIPPSLLEGFIRWAANQRFFYVDSLKEEITEYLRNNYQKNLSWLNNKKKFNLFLRVSKRDGKYCKYCNETTDLTLDHITPRSKGGEDKVENLQLLCRKCNSRKSNT